MGKCECFLHKKHKKCVFLRDFNFLAAKGLLHYFFTVIFLTTKKGDKMKKYYYYTIIGPVSRYPYRPTCYAINDSMGCSTSLMTTHQRVEEIHDSLEHLGCGVFEKREDARNCAIDLRSKHRWIVKSVENPKRFLCENSYTLGVVETTFKLSSDAPLLYYKPLFEVGMWQLTGTQVENAVVASQCGLLPSSELDHSRLVSYATFANNYVSFSRYQDHRSSYDQMWKEKVAEEPLALRVARIYNDYAKWEKGFRFIFHPDRHHVGLARRIADHVSKNEDMDREGILNYLASEIGEYGQREGNEIAEHGSFMRRSNFILMQLSEGKQAVFSDLIQDRNQDLSPRQPIKIYTA